MDYYGKARSLYSCLRLSYFLDLVIGASPPPPASPQLSILLLRIPLLAAPEVTVEVTVKVVLLLVPRALVVRQLGAGTRARIGLGL